MTTADNETLPLCLLLAINKYFAFCKSGEDSGCGLGELWAFFLSLSHFVSLPVPVFSSLCLSLSSAFSPSIVLGVAGYLY